MTKKPNILFLMSDEHRFDVTGCYGNTVVRTPVLDRLAESGTVFDNAYCPSPLCIPSRQAMMAGKYPRAINCENYGDDLAPFSMTFARRLSQYAYDTICCGKLHHMGADQMQGWTSRPIGDLHIAPRYIEGKDSSSFDCDFRAGRDTKWSDMKEIQRAGVGDGTCVARDRVVTRQALKVIRDRFIDPYYDRENPDQPLLLKVSLVQPHYPYITDDEELFTYYLNRVEAFLDNNVFDHPFLSQRSVEVGREVTRREVIRATAAYYAMIESMDSMYGEVLQALEHAGQDLDDWIIVYTTDHGEMLGEHGIWEKQKFFEASARVPLIIRWPKRFAARRVNENVNLVDLFATFCDLAEIPMPDGLDSRSLVPLMNGDSSGWENETASQVRGRNLMIKRDNLKYQYYGDDMPEVLFDLGNDPAETVNVINDPEYADVVSKFRNRRERYQF